LTVFWTTGRWRRIILSGGSLIDLIAAISRRLG
jgi:hypothetical protein